ncbi:MAG: hypothetical protein KAR40_15400 [Candidatus Sabulitectum sp.]|nr:hypothetical protein [Candidatus Sabulitectum sp.]
MNTPAAEDAHLDFETTSACDLKKAGVAVYAQHPTTRVLCFSWRIGDGTVYGWLAGDAMPRELMTHVANGGRVVAQNAAFERVMWNVTLPRQVSEALPYMRIGQQSCTMARAKALNLPGGLDNMAKALGTGYQKDMEGHKLMMKLARPRKRFADGTFTWWDRDTGGGHLLDRELEYCKQDVRVESDVDALLPDLSPAEQGLWEFDQEINEKGILFDMPLVRRAILLVAYAKDKANVEISRLTGGAVRKVTEAEKIKTWLNSRGVTCDSLAKGVMPDIEALAKSLGDDTALEVLAVRESASKTSTAKFSKMLECAGVDGRIRFMFAYHGASTGRWAGRLVQPQNFPRFDDENPQQRQAVYWLIDLLLSPRSIEEVHDCMDVVYGEVLPWLSKMLRSTIIAAPGHKLVGGDFSNIEGRVNAWLAGEHWKLKAFAAYDAKQGPDLYKLTYAKSFGIEVDAVTKDQRQIGKVQELASGYQGGVGAYISMAKQYKIELADLARRVFEGSDPVKWVSVQERFPQAVDKCGLPLFEWTALKLLVTSWRSAHPHIVQSWWNYQDAALSAVDSPGQPFDVANMSDGAASAGRVRYLSDGNFLYCCLPGGRVISYAHPYIKQSTVTRIRKDGTEYEAPVTELRFWGEDSTTRKWQSQSLYGGLLCENISQAVSRDIMVDSMYRVRGAGYPVTGTVHDEIITEPASSFGSREHFESLMEAVPAWAGGLPVSVSTWESQRYVK